MKPQIKNYLSAWLFLQDYYQYRKSVDPLFSYEKWAHSLKASDKSYVRFMVVGKRNISLEMTKAFALTMALNEEETTYFTYLVQYTQSTTPQQKELFAQKLIELSDSALSQTEIQDHFQFLSNPLIPRLQVLLSLKDIDSSDKNLAWILGCSENEIKDCLSLLEKFDLIEKIESGYKAKINNFKIADNYKNPGLETFYVQSLEISKKSIHLPKEDRRLNSLFIPMNKNEFDQFNQNLNSFMSEQLKLFNPDQMQDRRLFQILLNITAVSEQQNISQKINSSIQLQEANF